MYGFKIMNADAIYAKARQIRDVIRYIDKFNNALVILYIDDEIINSPLFAGHIKDICLIHQAGLKVLIVPGARRHIDFALSHAQIEWQMQDGCRITDESAMPLIKTAAFEVSNHVMTQLAGERMTAVIGNWVRARGKGILNGVDYGSAGEIDKVQISAIKTVLENGFVPIFPCIGWSQAGKPYNISSIQLATQLAMHLKAEKLFYLTAEEEITSEAFIIPPEIGLSPEGCIPAMNLTELDMFLAANTQNQHVQILSLLNLAKNACLNNVSRVHLINGSIDGSLPCEIFSDLGSGTMIYLSDYGTIRDMQRPDIPSVMTLIHPFVKKGILLPRTKKQLEATFSDYIVYELDGGLRACAALHFYDDMQAEIAAIAVDENFAHIGIGPKMIRFLIERAKTRNAQCVFVLTTQTADWFETQGFTHESVDTLPAKRKELWSPKRGSKVLRLHFQ